jgi:glutathione S-transferase
MPYQTEMISIFEGRGQEESYLAVNPWGAVPAIRLQDGRVLSESSAILLYLSGDTVYRPAHPFAEAKVLQWLSFEADYVQTSVGSLRFWTLTGKLKARAPSLVDGKRAAGVRALSILNRELTAQPFIVGAPTPPPIFRSSPMPTWRLTPGSQPRISRPSRHGSLASEPRRATPSSSAMGHKAATQESV